MGPTHWRPRERVRLLASRFHDDLFLRSFFFFKFLQRSRSRAFDIMGIIFTRSPSSQKRADLVYQQ